MLQRPIAFTDAVASGLQCLFATCVKLVPEVTIKFAFSNEETAFMVRLAIEEAASSSEAWHKVSH